MRLLNIPAFTPALAAAFFFGALGAVSAASLLNHDTGARVDGNVLHSSLATANGGGQVQRNQDWI